MGTLTTSLMSCIPTIWAGSEKCFKPFTLPACPQNAALQLPYAVSGSSYRTDVAAV